MLVLIMGRYQFHYKRKPDIFAITEYNTSFIINLPNCVTVFFIGHRWASHGIEVCQIIVLIFSKTNGFFVPKSIDIALSMQRQILCNT